MDGKLDDSNLSRGHETHVLAAEVQSKTRATSSKLGIWYYYFPFQYVQVSMVSYGT